MKYRTIHEIVGIIKGDKVNLTFLFQRTLAMKYAFNTHPALKMCLASKELKQRKGVFLMKDMKKREQKYTQVMIWGRLYKTFNYILGS